MKNVHVLVIPYPAQGHVIPLLEVARCLTIKGLKVTFVNTEAAHKLIMSAWSEKDDPNDLMQMVSIPDGMGPLDDRNDLGKLNETMSRVMPGKLEALIDGINRSEGAKITCIIADYCMGWVSKVTQKMCIRLATFCSGSAAFMSLIMSVQKLLDDQVIDNNGVPLKDQMTQLSTTMPSMNPAHFVWACVGDSATNKIIFNIVVLESKESAEMAGRIICNSTMELEHGAFALFPNILPIVSSVIYVAFGSFTIFNQTQFEELALGLELTNRSFLWVTRPGGSGSKDHVYPSGYMERVGTRGKIVSWAPQPEVLNHPSLACFMSHCGWNSTMEGVSNGVPFLCWPYFADQFLNTIYLSNQEHVYLAWPLWSDLRVIPTHGEFGSLVRPLAIFARSCLVDLIRMTTSVENNSVFRSFFEKQKLTGPNFIDWYRKLRLVLSIEDKEKYLEQPIPAAPVAVAPDQSIPPQALATYNEWVKNQNEIAVMMLLTMDLEIQHNLSHLGANGMLTELKALYSKQAKQELLQTVREFHTCRQEEGQSVSSYVLKMKSYLDQLERLGHPVTLNLGVSLILVGLSKEYDSFMLPKKVVAPALHAIRAGKVQKNKNRKPSKAAKGIQRKGKGKKAYANAEPSYAPKPKIPLPPKKDNPAKDAICYHCGEVGHWRRNYPTYLTELLKKKQLSQ
ncbi:UDP-glycosyltransferase 83A1 [Tanacetum coccineum]